EYYKKIEQLGLQDRVKVIGPFAHAELVKEYSNNDIYIHYSLTEGFPRVILEAQSCGLPVISSNVGYISDILSDGENVILLKDYTPESLKEKLDYIMIEDNHIRIKENGRIHVLKNFDSTVIYDKYRKVILGEEE
ncbi:glycosyltransferase family 4 protein, partial [Vibrio vulnificus]